MNKEQTFEEKLQHTLSNINRKITQIIIKGFEMFALDDMGNLYEIKWNDDKNRYDFIKQRIKLIEEE